MTEEENDEEEKSPSNKNNSGAKDFVSCLIAKDLQ